MYTLYFFCLFVAPKGSNSRATAWDVQKAEAARALPVYRVYVRDSSSVVYVVVAGVQRRQEWLRWEMIVIL